MIGQRMNKMLSVAAALMVWIQCFSQEYPMYMLMPMGVSNPYSDTMLNTYRIMKQNKITRILATKTEINSHNKNIYTIKYQVNNGVINARRYCLRYPKSETYNCATDLLIYA